MKIEPSPDSLATPRLRLAPVGAADAPWLQRLMELPEVNRSTLVIPTPCAPDFAAEWIKNAEAGRGAGKAYTFALRLAEDARPIGTMFLLLNPAYSHAELGYFIDPAFWNKGYGTEAARALLEFGFKRLALNRIFAVYFSGNPASGRIMQKIGMKHEGCRRQHVVKNGTFIDIEQYGMLKNEWAPAK